MTTSTTTSSPMTHPTMNGGNENVLAFDTESTLFVNKNVSLTLSPESLLIKGGENASKPAASRRSATLDASAYSEPLSSTSSRAISLRNVLWAEMTESELIISYAKETSKTVLQLATIKHPIEEERDRVESWIARLKSHAYGKSQLQKRAKVLINPKSGKGNSEKMYAKEVAPILEAAHLILDVQVTKGPKEAISIAENLEIEAYDIIICCSGDGLPFEVFNGLGKRKDARKALAKLAIAHIPCGSGNGLHCNLHGNIKSASIAAVSIVKGVRMPLDLVSITQGDTRILSFLSQALGIVAEFDLGTEHLRWMGGTRFIYGFVIKSLQKKTYPCDIAAKVVTYDKSEMVKLCKEARDRKDDLEAQRDLGMTSEEGLPELQFGTVQDPLPEGWELVPHDNIGNFYCGNMSWMGYDVNFFPAALPNDGCLDLVTIDYANLSRLAALQLMPAVESGKFFGLPYVNYRKVEAYRVIPKNQSDGYIAIDGERVPFAPFQAEVHKGLGTVLSMTGYIYESPGPVL